MNKQRSFSDQEYEKYCNKTRREQFLEDMNAVMPWQELIDVIEPFYSKAKVQGARWLG